MLISIKELQKYKHKHLEMLTLLNAHAKAEKPETVGHLLCAGCLNYYYTLESYYNQLLILCVSLFN